MTEAHFAGYTDVAVVGQGGLGRVYRAARISTGGLVAIKELPDVASASSAWHRAHRELEALLRLKGHAGVVSVEEIFEGPNGPCIVMEFMPGGSLNERLRTGPLSVPEAVLVGQQVSQALQAAHEVGIVHRDVKPHNLMINGFGHIKVCDFGISALTRGEAGRTQTRALTLAYASPEELDGSQTVGPAADVYSFAATMQHLITGRKPSFQDRMRGVPPASGQRADPAMSGVTDALALAMSNHPADRPTMSQLGVVFESASTALGTHRLSRLRTGPLAEDSTQKRAHAKAAPLVSAAPPPRQQRVDQQRLGPAPLKLPSLKLPGLVQPAAFEPLEPPNVARFNSMPTRVDAPAPTTTLFDDAHQDRRRRRGWALAVTLVALLATIVVSVMVVRGNHNDDAFSAPTTAVLRRSVANPDATAESAAEVAGTLTTAPTLPPPTAVFATGAAPVTTVLSAEIAVTPPTTQPPVVVTAPPQTVIVTVPPQIVVITVQVAQVTTPPTNPPTTPAPEVSGAEAAQVLTHFYELINARQYADAWNLETAVGQSASASFDEFTAFWNTISSVSLSRTSVVGAVPDGIQVTIDISLVLVAGPPQVDRHVVNVVRTLAGPLIDEQHFVKRIS